jgi:hypothetical protein
MAIETLAYVKALEAAGVPRAQAEAQVAALAQHALSDLATEHDITEVKGDIASVKADIAAVRAEMATKSDTIALRTEMATKADLAELKYELTWRLFGLMLGVAGPMNGILFVLLRLTR